MPTLRVDLQAGFDGGPAILRVNGEERLHTEALRTDYSVGLADTAELTVPSGPARIELELPRRGIAHALTATVTGATHVGIWVEPNGEVKHQVVAEPFRYF